MPPPAKPDRVSRVVKGGRRMRFRATVFLGDGAGHVGLGLGKGADVQIAVRKAVNQAKKHIITVPMVAGTITHPIELKFKSARIRMLPASEGTGVKLGGALRKMVEMVGVSNIIGKSYGTNNRIVVAQCAMLALAQLRTTEASGTYMAGLAAAKAEAAAKAKAAAAEAEAGPRTGRGTTGGKRHDKPEHKEEAPRAPAPAEEAVEANAA